ncbi:hypothetical protein BDQ17DRAFT_1441201 [Cyathus striatus]|nr:hypothetical protein BDQ17DRAFT_1441201 [Cyathus striatus]
MSALLEIFVNLATDPATLRRAVVECSGERWTYEELHSITVFLLRNPADGGVEAWGNHGPSGLSCAAHLMTAMLQNISPTFTVVPKVDTHNIKLVEGEYFADFKVE